MQSKKLDEEITQMDFEIALEKEVKHRDYMELYKDPKQGP